VRPANQATFRFLFFHTSRSKIKIDRLNIFRNLSTDQDHNTFVQRRQWAMKIVYVSRVLHQTEYVVENIHRRQIFNRIIHTKQCPTKNVAPSSKEVGLRSFSSIYPSLLVSAQEVEIEIIESKFSNASPKR
jgi:hypothetical protein